MDQSLLSEIDRVFKDGGHVLDDKILVECVSICKMFVLKPEDLRFRVEAVNYKPSFTRSEYSPITMETLTVIKQHYMNENTKRAQPKTQGLTAARVNRSKLPSHMARNLGTPSVTPIKLEVASETPSLLINDSKAVNVTFVGPQATSEAKRKRSYHYMFEKISERSENLDSIIDDFAELILAHYKISEFSDPSASSDAEVAIIGRITHDTETSSMSKLAEGGIMIESSRWLSAGARFPLVFEPAIKIRGGVRGVGGFGLYPGAIVAFKGKNGGGGYFNATEVLTIPPLKPSPASQGTVGPSLDTSSSQKPASITVACGPFTADSDTSYKPWRVMLQQIKLQKPDVLLLIGPFVDSTHPKIKIGDIDVSPANLFRAHFIDPLKAFASSSPSSLILLVPSIRDIVSNHAAFPQPELDAELFNFTPNIHLLPNPARFSINNVSFAVSSVDSLFHLRKEEYFKRGVDIDSIPTTENDLPNDAMANLCRHLLLQRSYYPIFPTPQDLSSEVNLDMSHFDGIRIVDDGSLDYAPDVFILPSKLKQFSKLIHSTNFLNPSFLSKGTYGTISITPSSGAPIGTLEIEVVKLEA